MARFSTTTRRRIAALASRAAARSSRSESNQARAPSIAMVSSPTMPAIAWPATVQVPWMSVLSGGTDMGIAVTSTNSAQTLATWSSRVPASPWGPLARVRSLSVAHKMPISVMLIAKPNHFSPWPWGR